jgi:hypothetical protein
LTTDNPFPPKPPEYSLNEPEVLPPVAYPDFGDLRYEEKLEILTDAIVILRGRPLELILRDTGISREEYKELIEDSQYINMVKDKSTKECLIPYVPAMFETLGIKAAEGDPSAVKHTLQTIGTLAPADVLVNQNLMNLSDEQIEQETKMLLEDLQRDKKDE